MHTPPNTRVYVMVSFLTACARGYAGSETITHADSGAAPLGNTTVTAGDGGCGALAETPLTAPLHQCSQVAVDCYARAAPSERATCLQAVASACGACLENAELACAINVNGACRGEFACMQSCVRTACATNSRANCEEIATATGGRCASQASAMSACMVRSPCANAIQQCAEIDGGIVTTNLRHNLDAGIADAARLEGDAGSSIADSGTIFDSGSTITDTRVGDVAIDARRSVDTAIADNAIDARATVDARIAADAGMSKRAFVTSQTRNGLFSSVAYAASHADTFCEQAATAQRLGGAWFAFVYDAHRLTLPWTANRYVSLRGDALFTRQDGYFPTADARMPWNITFETNVLLSATRNPDTASVAIWTGVGSTDCGDWNRGSVYYTGSVGDILSANFYDDADTYTCNDYAAVLCFER